MTRIMRSVPLWRSHVTSRRGFSIGQVDGSVMVADTKPLSGYDATASSSHHGCRVPACSPITQGGEILFEISEFRSQAGRS